MLTNKAKYGLEAMLRLAGVEAGEVAAVTDIAETNAISKKSLDRILAELRRAGFACSKKGKGGGYALARPARDIGAGAIIRVLDGPLAPLPCASVTAFLSTQTDHVFLDGNLFAGHESISIAPWRRHGFEQRPQRQ